MLVKWNEKLIAVSYFLDLSPLGLPYIKKAGPEAWPNSCGKVNSTFAQAFQHEKRGASCQARISDSQESTRMKLKTCKIIWIRK